VANATQSTTNRFTTVYLWTIVALGAATLAYSVYWLPMPRIDLRFLMLTGLMIVVSSRLSVQIPRVNTNITVSDTFIFLVLLVYGGFAGILLALADGLFGALRIRGKLTTILFNCGMMVCSTFITVLVLQLFFGPTSNLRSHGWSTFIAAVATMALVQYFSNTGISAIGLALKTGQSIWPTWQKHYLWTSITYLAGAAVAAVASNSIERAGLTILAVGGPVIFVLYFTYQKYLNEIKETSAQAEQAERERAEQAEQHVEELNCHIAEQKRISDELEQSKNHFRHAAFHDALTDLPNRALLAENLKIEIDRVKQHEDCQFAVLFLDLDRFKNVNDSLGHSIGNQLLIAIARRLEGCMREGDIVARLGGDEFAILLASIPNMREATKMAERVQEKLQTPFNLSGHEVFTTASIGIALSAIGYEHPENVLRDADTAMYRAKAQGKARYELFDEGMHSQAVYLLQLETDLRRALEREEFCVYYQPIVSLENGELAGLEALVRWQHPERGMISPAEFIGMAEEHGFILPLGQWVLERACRQLVQWQRQSLQNRSLFMSVNLSAKQMAQTGLVNQIKEVLEETNLDPAHLKLEITESAVMENAEMAVTVLKQLKALGVQLSVDDFGTGYSSLSYLHRFPLDTLKIDQSFVSRIGEADENGEIVRTIVTLAENMGMDVVAEGIETLEQLSELRRLDCRYGQGYLFARPLEARAATAWISHTPHVLTDLFSQRDNFVPARPVVLQLRAVSP
jgi:diguanylate cyclase (GGDEF)-like protein